MKRLPTTAFYLLIVTMLLTIMPTDAEAKIYEDTIRLHILANSNSDEDQNLKIKIRDRLISEYGNILSKFETKDEAEIILQNLLPQITESVNLWISEFGFNYKAEAVIGIEWYETRDYDNFSLPCGYYTSLKIMIGEAEGNNWWCVMYPPLCLELATENAPADDGLIDYTNEEIKLIKGGKYNVKFKILEEVSRCFSKTG